jgi:hypothetical protein
MFKKINYPLGVVPEVYWRLATIEARMQSLQEATERYRAANVEPLKAWSEEFAELRAEYAEWERKTPLGMPSKVAGVKERL